MSEFEEKKNPLICRSSEEIVALNGKKLPAKEIISDTTCRELIREAMEVMKQSYAPYSNFNVGAALLANQRRIYTGCNVENASYSVSICAERLAIGKAISEGVRKFKAIAIVGGKNFTIEDYCPPCGVCRQALLEFSDPETFIVILARKVNDYWLYPLADLMPLGFSPKNLNNT